MSRHCAKCLICIVCISSARILLFLFNKRNLSLRNIHWLCLRNLSFRNIHWLCVRTSMQTFICIVHCWQKNDFGLSEWSMTWTCVSPLIHLSFSWVATIMQKKKLKSLVCVSHWMKSLGYKISGYCSNERTYIL